MQRGKYWSSLRKRKEQAADDLLEYNWGFEEPERIRKYTDPQHKHWDQIDVRMYFFDKAMKKTKWASAADGMWYIQDYVDFMAMLQKLDLPTDTGSNELATHEKYKLDDESVADNHRADDSDFAEIDEVAESEDSAEEQDTQELPRRFHVHDRACHRFSVLSWFFDCRDAGACRYAWEDYVLEYFGAYMSAEQPSQFDVFQHLEKLPKPQYNYYKNPWFQITLFLEHNFRNAIAQMHYKLFEMRGAEQVKDRLQKKAKMLWNRQISILNNRSCFDGLQVGDDNGASLLSFQRFHARRNANMTLRERIMSQLHDELPGLDPFLLTYITQFRIPDAELFLRMIRCPNVLALRELAVQHRHLLGGSNTASSVQPAYHIQQTLKFFPIAVQSEILYMFKFVETDDSVYVHTPALHESKLVLVPQDLLRRWIRESLEVANSVQSLLTPLQIKCYMFTMPELHGGGVGAFTMLKSLLYTIEAMMNYGSKRSIVFVLLQVRLALKQLKNASRRRSNPYVPLFPELHVDEDARYSMQVWADKDPVQWTPGTCLEEWPRRDVNDFAIPRKNVFVDVAVSTNASTGIKIDEPQSNTLGDATNINYLYMDTVHAVGMSEHERSLWLLLLYSRPHGEQFVAEDSTRVSQYTGHSTTRDSFVAKLAMDNNNGALACSIVDDIDSPLFFEKLEEKQRSDAKSFPAYVQAIITVLPERKCIYVPKVFAQKLRKVQPRLHDVVYAHAGSHWQMVCVATRAWAWKRLLVKSIFFDALAKIMTRSSVQLSLYAPLQQTYNADCDNAANEQKIFNSHKNTSEVFGQLEHKLVILKRNSMPKRMQLLFTTHARRRRKASIDNTHSEFDAAKIENITRQFTFVEFYKKHAQEMQEVSSCRYMLLDSRLATKHLTTTQANEVEGAMLHRCYLYLSEKCHDMLVQFRKQIYIKFPPEYGVMRDETTYVAGKMRHSESEHMYATCFDSRTYSCALSKLQRKADSAEMMRVLQECTDSQSKMPCSFPSTKASADNCQSWIYKFDGQVMMCKLVSSIIFHQLSAKTGVLTLNDQKNMYTLPDYFSDRQLKNSEVGILCVEDEDALAWSEDIGHRDSAESWVKLRCTTKWIAKSQKVLQDAASHIDHDLLRPLLQRIRRDILLRTSVDKSL